MIPTAIPRSLSHLSRARRYRLRETNDPRQFLLPLRPLPLSLIISHYPALALGAICQALVEDSVENKETFDGQVEDLEHASASAEAVERLRQKAKPGLAFVECGLGAQSSVFLDHIIRFVQIRRFAQAFRLAIELDQLVAARKYNVKPKYPKIDYHSLAELVIKPTPRQLLCINRTQQKVEQTSPPPNIIANN